MGMSLVHSTSFCTEEGECLGCCFAPGMMVGSCGPGLDVIAILLEPIGRLWRNFSQSQVVQK